MLVKPRRSTLMYTCFDIYNASTVSVVFISANGVSWLTSAFLGQLRPDIRESMSNI